MLNLNLNLLHTFQVFTANPSLKEAAAALGVTPSALSQSLKKLEEQLGGQLFLREHKKVILTARAEELKLQILPQLLSLEKSLQSFREDLDQSTLQGEMVIGAPVELGSKLIVKEFAKFRKQFPKIHLRMRTGSPAKLLEYVSKGEVDFCFAADGPHFKNLNASISAQKLMDEEFGLVCSPQTWLKIKKDLSLENLSSYPHLDYVSTAETVKRWYQLHFKRKPKDLELSMIAENSVSLVEGVKNEMGLALVPLQRIPSELKNEEVKVIRPTERLFLNPILLIQHANKIPSRAEKEFIKLLKQSY